MIRRHTTKPELMGRKEIDEAARYILSRVGRKPVVGLVLGSGLGDFADELHVETIVNASDVPHYPGSSVQGHAGKLVFGRLNDSSPASPPLLVFKGRVHFYESGDLAKTLFPIRLAAKLGIKSLIATNAAGGINQQFSSGDLMLIREIINLTFLDVLKLARVSPSKRNRKPIIDKKLSDTILLAASSVQMPIHEGTYCWLKGPSYETPAEIRMLRTLGADAVGMSTVPELQLASVLGMRVAAISLISNLAAGISQSKLSHAEVSETANSVKAKFTSLMKAIIRELS